MTARIELGADPAGLVVRLAAGYPVAFGVKLQGSTVWADLGGLPVLTFKAGATTITWTSTLASAQVAQFAATSSQVDAVLALVGKVSVALTVGTAILGLNTSGSGVVVVGAN